MSSVVVIGAQWGDEGKGKIVDYLAQKANAVVRYSGGSNAGHTVVVDDVAYKLRLLPSGVLYKDKINILGNGVVINPAVVLQEIAGMKAQGIDCSNLLISDRAHVVMPYHAKLDELQEAALGEHKIGTTKGGIGPITLVFNNQPFELRQWKIVDPQSVEVTVSLYGSKTDEKLPASLFRFRKQNNPLNNKKGR